MCTPQWSVEVLIAKTERVVFEKLHHKVETKFFSLQLFENFRTLKDLMEG